MPVADSIDIYNLARKLPIIAIEVDNVIQIVNFRGSREINVEDDMESYSHKKHPSFGGIY